MLWCVQKLTLVAKIISGSSLHVAKFDRYEHNPLRAHIWTSVLLFWVYRYSLDEKQRKSLRIAYNSLYVYIIWYSCAYDCRVSALAKSAGLRLLKYYDNFYLGNPKKHFAEKMSQHLGTRSGYMYVFKDSD
jgi:hypothetical protein